MSKLLHQNIVHYKNTIFPSHLFIFNREELHYSKNGYMPNNRTCTVAHTSNLFILWGYASCILFFPNTRWTFGYTIDQSRYVIDLLGLELQRNCGFSFSSEHKYISWFHHRSLRCYNSLSLCCVHSNEQKTFLYRRKTYCWYVLAILEPMTTL